MGNILTDILTAINVAKFTRRELYAVYSEHKNEISEYLDYVINAIRDLGIEGKTKHFIIEYGDLRFIDESDKVTFSKPIVHDFQSFYLICKHGDELVEILNKYSDIMRDEETIKKLSSLKNNLIPVFSKEKTGGV